MCEQDQCGERLDMLARSDARFCSTRCRMAAHRAARRAADVVPAELRAQQRWVRHSARKVPLQLHGAPASSTDAATWCTYIQAAASAVGTGRGFVLNGDGVACIDLDYVVIDGVLTPAAQRLVDSLPATYTEVSPSGTGLHLWCHINPQLLPRGRRFVRDGVNVEVYGTGRYITVTGNAWREAPIANYDAALADLLA